MTKYDFDKIIDRRNTDCLKYDFAIQRGRPADVLSFLVADMDFPIAREIQEALVERCQHAIFGYSESTEAYFHAVEHVIPRFCEIVFMELRTRQAPVPQDNSIRPTRPTIEAFSVRSASVIGQFPWPLYSCHGISM